MGATGLDATGLARLAGIAHTTITRFLHDPRYKFVPSTQTLTKLEGAAAAFVDAGGGKLPPNLGGSRLPPKGCFVYDPDELRILRLFRAIPRDQWSRVIRVVGALSEEQTRLG